MALNNISELSTTAASNTDFAGTSILGTGLVSTADDSFRNLASFEAKWWNDIGAVNIVAGTGDAVTVTTLTLYTAHKTGMMFRFVAGAANTGPATLNLDGLGAKAIRKISGGTDVALAAGDIAAGETYTVIYRASANSAAGAWVLVAYVNKAPGALPYPPGTLYGLTLSNNSGTPAKFLDFAAGKCRDDADTVNIDYAAAITAKDLETAWAVGSSAGLLASGAAVTNTTYHIFAIKRPDTGVCDYAADTSVTGANIATNTNAAYTKIRRIGSVVRTGGSIKAFVQTGDIFLWSTPTADVSATNPGTSAVTRTLTLPVGLRVQARLVVGANAVIASTDNPGGIYISDLSMADVAPGTGAVYSVFLALVSAVQTVVGSEVNNVFTNTSAQVRSRLQVSTSGTILYIATLGWTDTRGRV